MIQDKIEQIHNQIDELSKYTSELTGILGPILNPAAVSVGAELKEAKESYESDIAEKLEGGIRRLIDLKASIADLIFRVDLVDRTPKPAQNTNKDTIIRR